jgi:tetratricopeptide (TPR) repeat protein
VFAARQPGFESLPIRPPTFSISLARLPLFPKLPAMPLALALFFLFALALPGATPGTPSVVNLLETARIDYQTGHFDSALTKLDQRDRTEEANGEALDLRGAIALEQGKFSAAAHAFQEAHKLAPELFAPRLHLGDLYLREKKYGEAREVFQRLASETNILISNERVRYGLLLVALATHQESAAKAALENIKFPTETPAYYFAQAASDFSHGNERSAKKWIATASEIFEPQSLAWFARPLYDLGWLKDKPPPPTI